MVWLFENTCKLYRITEKNVNWEKCVQMVNGIRADFIFDTRHLYWHERFIRWWDKINFIWKYDQTELGRFTELLQCCWRHTVLGKGGVVVASVNDCNGFDVGVTSGGFVSEEELKHTAVALLVLSFVNTCKLNWRTRITGENWEICVQMVNSLRVDFIHDTRHLCTSVKIDDIIVMSPGFLKGKQVVKSANTRNGVQVCFFKTKTTTKLC